MLAVKYLVKLYEMPAEYGLISAFDTYANTIFTGTENGMLLKFAVEGALDADTAVTESNGADCSNAFRRNEESATNGDGCTSATKNYAAQRRRDLPPPPTAPPGGGSERIYTTLVRRASLATHRIERLQHSRTHSLLFVLCGHRLTVLNSVSFSPIQTIANHVGTFFVSDSQHNSTRRTGLHVICASELNGRGLSVFEFDATQGKHARVILAQELVLPEPVQVIVTYGSIACIGMRREYSLLSLSDGNSCGVLPLGGGRQPLVAPGDGEVFMRYNQSIFSVSMRSMPSGRVLGRTVQLEDEVLSFAVRHPFLFAFTEHYCDVCSLYDDDVTERLPLPGCLFGSQLGRGDFLYAASRTKIWMAALNPLRHQLADLVERFKVEEAFHLLGSQRNNTALDLQGIELELHIMAGFAYLHHCRPKDAMLHFNDHIDPRDLLLNLPEGIPPSSENYSPELRDLLTSHKSKSNSNSSDMNSHTHASDEENERKNSTSANNATDVGSTTTTIMDPTKLTATHTNKLSSNGNSKSGNGNRVKGQGDTKRESASFLTHLPITQEEDVVEVNDFWAEWDGPCPYNTYAGEVHRVWLETYETYPLVPSTAGASSRGESLMLRQVPDWGPVTAADFLERSWELFKDELVVYFRSRLSHAPRIYSRAMEYALLVLALEAQDHRGAHRIVSLGSALAVEDCYDLLCALREYRLLACLLHRRGYAEAAKRVMASRVYVSSYVPTPLPSYRTVIQWMPLGKTGEPKAGASEVVQEGTKGEDDGKGDHFCSPVYQLLPEAMHPIINQLLQPAAILQVSNGPIPPSLSEPMYLASQLNLPALLELLRDTPEVFRVVDEEGNSLLHLLLSLLSLPCNATDASSEGASALLNLVLSAVALALDAGCSVTGVNAAGQTCLDVAACAAGGAFVDVVIAAFLADAAVRDMAAAVEKEEGGVGA